MKIKRALVCHPQMPQYDRQRGSQRALEVIEFLQEAGWAVSFVAQHGNNGERYMRILQQRGVATYIGFDSCTDQLIGGGRLDLAILGFWHVAELCMPIIRRISPTTRIIVDSIDLHLLRNARRIFRASAHNRPSGLLDATYASDMIREVNVYAAADGVLAVSQKEADLINDLVGDPTLAHAVPLSEGLTRSTVPFGERRGILFVGNFLHKPNIEAAEYLCKDILPGLDQEILGHHPVYIVGNALNDTVRSYGSELPQVRMVGWVPSLQPYFERARISVVPLLHGAGTKGKLIQAMMSGIPSVSTSIGIEGLNLQDGEHVLVADDPSTFADSMTRLLKDAKLWKRVARHGRTHISAVHGREPVRRRFLQVVSTILAKEAKPALLADPDVEYQQLVRRIREVVRAALPPETTVAVVSKGDNELLKLVGRKAWHFPQTADGVYAGYYPADSAEAIAQLEALRAKGADFVLFPRTAFWWLEHYAEFGQHLESRYRAAVRQQGTCLIFALCDPRADEQQELGARTQSSHDKATATASHSLKNQRLGLSQGAPDKLRPVIPEIITSTHSNSNAPVKNILVLGVYLADQENNVDDIVLTLSKTKTYSPTQRWVALGGKPPTKRVARVTVNKILERAPKFQIINELLAKEDLTQYEYVLIVDDDIVLPHHFVDHFISLQAELNFSIAQPARTSNSNVEHPIVEQQRGVLARQTLFVEIGPVVSVHKSAYDLIFPFDLISPMGWGYENVWSYLLAQRNMKMGIIDVVPVNHGLRKPLAHYSWDEANRARTALLKKHDHYPLKRCFKVFEVINLKRGGLQRQQLGRADAKPLMSVIIPTYNRAELLKCSLESLASQTLPKNQYEVILVDDGSSDDTSQVWKHFSSRIRLKYLRIEKSGISSAKNLGIFASTGSILMFFDDDDIADKDLLRQHLTTHTNYPLENVAVLGYTTWAPSLEVTELMNYVTNIGHFQFMYTNLRDGQLLDFTYFWGGRSSCKRSLLVNNGVFRQDFRFGSEDIELAYRLSKLLVERRVLHQEFQVRAEDTDLRYRLSTVGLKVVFNRKAVQYMNRPVTYNEFCQRCEKQGISQYLFSRLHADPFIQQYCLVIDAEEKWKEMKQTLEEKVRRVHEIERLLASGVETGERNVLLRELRNLYRWTFDAFKVKGVIEAKSSGISTHDQLIVSVGIVA